MLEDAEAEGLEVEGREVGIEWPDEVFVIPLCFFDLEAYSFNLDQFFLGQIDNKSHA